MRKKAEPAPAVKVILVWGFKREDRSIHTLDDRIYDKDRYDGRAGENLPYFEQLEDACKFMEQNPGHEGICQLNAAEARSWRIL